MRRIVIQVVLMAVAAGLGAGWFGCCPKENAAKTASCKASKSSNDCKMCCGGNYSYTGDGSCTCY